MDVRSGSGNGVFRLGGTVANVAAMAERNARWVRLVRAAVGVAIVLAVGTYGYWEFATGEHSVVEALYMTVISISTVGFTEVIPIRDDAMRLFTIGLILFGGATILYFLAAAAAFVVEGDVLYGFWRRGLRKRLSHLEEHVVVCGLGRVGSHAFRELHLSRTLVVGVDRDGERLENLVARFGPKILFAVGDAADEAILAAVRIDKASALIAALADDRDNFLLCVTARQLNPALRLIVRLVDPANADMFADVHAEAIVYPPSLSGTRMANDLMRPELTAFTARLLAGDAFKREVGEVPVPAGSGVIGQTLGALDISATDALIIGHRRAGTDERQAFTFRPGPEVRLLLGDILLVHGTRHERKAVADLIASERRVTPPRAPVTEIVSTVRPGDPAATHHAKQGHTRRGHVIVAGAGAVGRAVVHELLRQDVEVVVVDANEAHLGLIDAPEGRVSRIVGDLSQRATLARTDLQTSRGFVSALQPLRDNLFLAALVHHANPRARVVARVGTWEEAKRLRAVGAAVTNPGEIGGVHLAHLAIHPELVQFAAGLEATWDRLEQLAIVPLEGNVFAGTRKKARRLGDLEIQHTTGCVVLGLRGRKHPVFAYHPTDDARVTRGGALLVLGEHAEIALLRTILVG